MTTVLREYRKDHEWNDDDWHGWHMPLATYEACGFTRVATGSRAYVLEHEMLPGLAIKVARYDVRNGADGIAPKDAWLTYVLAAKRWDDPRVPKVYHVAMYRRFYVAVMERLYPIHHWKDVWDTARPIVFAERGETNEPLGRRLRKLIRKHGFRLDLETSETNILKRKNGQHVVTDPVYCRDGPRTGGWVPS